MGHDSIQPDLHVLVTFFQDPNLFLVFSLLLPSPCSMPRLRLDRFRITISKQPLLRPLLLATRDLESARNELRWLTDHAVKLSRLTASSGKETATPSWQTLVRNYCAQRGTGKPLQYILGSEYFGELEIKCEPGVLIPRSVSLHLLS